ncbi:MAG: DNA alkylation repair protein [Erysipelotrichaceae bacterium]|nr:DNA alkylation repair protein [Erysipelotrichaceae bacterium]
MDDIKTFLFDHQDQKYGEFQRKLIPNIDGDTIIGVRTPILRQYAKELVKLDDIDDFLDILPHTYFDENQLHAFIISLKKDYDEVISYIDRFLPYVDNWATCDQMSPNIFKKYHVRLLEDINRWLSSSEAYTIRFGINMMMSHFLDGDFKPNYLKQIADIRHDDYYVKMVVAWYFSVALVKQYDDTITYFTTPQLDPWVHNKAIQKAIESRRISDEGKQYLRTLKIKKGGQQ